MVAYVADYNPKNLYLFIMIGMLFGIENYWIEVNIHEKTA